MGELSGSAAATASPKAAPRWAGARCLVPVLKFNGRCIELFCSMAASGNAEPLFGQNAELWRILDADARRRLAGVPFVLVDIGFSDDAWWQEVVHTRGRKPEPSLGEPGLPKSVTESLMYETLMFCWQMVSASRTVGMSVFAMSPAVVDIVGALAPHDVREIADRQHGAVQVRWNTHRAFWYEVLKAALDADEERLATLHLRARLMLMGRLVRALS